MKGPQHDDRIDRGEGKFGRHVVGDGGQAQNLDLQCLPGGLQRLEIRTRVALQPEDTCLARHRFPDHLCVGGQLVAAGRNRLDQRDELSDVVAVGAGEDYREWDALRVGDEVVLGAWSSAIGGIRSCF